MIENDIKSALDEIKPDIYYQARLKTKIKGHISRKRTYNIRKVMISFCSCFTAFILIFGIMIFNPNGKKINNKHTDEISPIANNGFIILASAEDSNAKTVFHELKTDKIYEHKIFLKYIDTSDYNQTQYKKVVKSLKQEIEALSKEKNNRKYTFINTQYSNVIIAHSSANYFKLKIDNIDNLQEITVNNNSKYGKIIYEDETPVFGPHLNSPFTIPNDEFNNDKQIFRWILSQEAEEHLINNPNSPISDFEDIITFTVKYKTGEICRTSLYLKFNENGIATISLNE